GALTSMDAPRVAENLPTPWVGVWERINIGVFLLWVAALATALLRTTTDLPDISERPPTRRRNRAHSLRYSPASHGTSFAVTRWVMPNYRRSAFVLATAMALIWTGLHAAAADYPRTVVAEAKTSKDATP